MVTHGPDLDKYRLGWREPENSASVPETGLKQRVVQSISDHKSEPDWLRQFRLRSFQRFERKPMLAWFVRLMPDLDFQNIYYYLKPAASQGDA